MEDYLDWMAIEDPVEKHLVLRSAWQRLTSQQQQELIEEFAPDLMCV